MLEGLFGGGRTCRNFVASNGIAFLMLGELETVVSRGLSSIRRMFVIVVKVQKHRSMLLLSPIELCS